MAYLQTAGTAKATLGHKIGDYLRVIKYVTTDELSDGSLGG